jgi:hypothetical protein
MASLGNFEFFWNFLAPREADRMPEFNFSDLGSQDLRWAGADIEVSCLPRTSTQAIGYTVIP